MIHTKGLCVKLSTPSFTQPILVRNQNYKTLVITCSFLATGSTPFLLRSSMCAFYKVLNRVSVSAHVLVMALPVTKGGYRCQEYSDIRGKLSLGEGNGGGGGVTK